MLGVMVVAAAAARPHKQNWCDKAVAIVTKSAPMDIMVPRARLDQAQGGSQAMLLLTPTMANSVQMA